MSKVHIGKKIKEVWKRSRLKGTEFASAINRDRQVIYDIFKRESIDTDLLKQISKVLNHNFFMYYSPLPSVQVKETKPDYGYATKEDLALAISNVQSSIIKEIEKLREELLSDKKKAPRKYPKK